jgi:3-oxoacyl-[acyl-carrier protein] reductase
MPVSIFVANAGRGVRVRHIEDVTEEEFDLNLVINTKANFLLIKALVPEMKAEKWGRYIIHISMTS